jgi:hypothetical protein
VGHQLLVGVSCYSIYILKTELKELFGRESEVSYIVEQIYSKNWVIIGGKGE